MKKKYTAPTFNVTELNTTDIICTSTETELLFNGKTGAKIGEVGYDQLAEWNR